MPVFLKDFMNRADLVNVVRESEPVEVLDYVQVWAEPVPCPEPESSDEESVKHYE